jgi:ABC-type Fe3+-hydroxamate transport system substrate-binding protein
MAYEKGRTAITRRQALAAAMGALLMPVAARANGRRIAAIDWAVLETALALGIVPVAATELIQFRKIVVEPDVPESVADIGLRGTPNYELLRTLAPDLILSSNFYEGQRGSLERIAPVFSVPVYVPGTPPYALAEEATRAFGKELGREAEADGLIAESADQIVGLRQTLAEHARRPVFVVSIGDARHFRAFGADSMPGDVLARLGFENAWKDATSYSAAAPVGIEALARVPDASLVIVSPVPPEARWTLGESALWQALPMVREGRVATIDPVNHFGGLPSARRFARLLGEAMLARKAAANG